MDVCTYITFTFLLSTERLLQETGLTNKPDQIFNIDETGISSQVTSRQKAYGKKGQRLYQKKVCVIIRFKNHI